MIGNLIVIQVFDKNVYIFMLEVYSAISMASKSKQIKCNLVSGIKWDTESSCISRICPDN